jgi:tetratricopeptide (TPR) repeat protein
VILGSVFGVVIVCLVATIVAIKLLPRENNTVEISYEAEGYESAIDDSTVALVFSENINKKMDEDDAYNYDNAISDYKKAYNESTGKLKAYVMMKYANFVYENTEDAEQAVELLNRFDANNEVPEDDTITLISYYTELRNYYMILKESEEVKRCADMISKLTGPAKEIPLETVIKMTGGASDE